MADSRVRPLTRQRGIKTMTVTKAFWKSKAFWGGLGSILTGFSIIFTSSHVSTEAILAIGTGALAVYGRVVASAPLAKIDKNEADGEGGKSYVSTSAKSVDADKGN